MSAEQKNDLVDVIPLKVTRTVAGKDITIAQVKVGRVPLLLTAALPVYSILAPKRQKGQAPDTSFDLQSLFLMHSDDCLNILAVLSEQPRSWVDGLEIDEAVSLFSDLMEVNLDFFVRKLLPLLSASAVQLAAKLQTLLPPKGGQTASKP